MAPFVLTARPKKDSARVLRFARRSGAVLLSGVFLLSLLTAAGSLHGRVGSTFDQPLGAKVGNHSPAPGFGVPSRSVVPGSILSQPLAPGPGVSGAPTVVSTLDLASNRLLPGNRQPALQYDPQFGLYDPINGMLYIRGNIGATISVVDPSTGTVITEIPAQIDQTAYAVLPNLVLDPVNGLLYAPNYNEGNVSIIDPSTNSVVGSVTVLNGPYGLTYDPFDGNIYVTGYNGGNVTAFSPTTDRTVANITVGKDPTAIAYNAANHLLYVADSGAHNVSVINSSQEKVVATVPVGNFPSGLGIDTVSDLVDVPADNGGGQSNVTIIDGSNNTVRGVVGVGMDASSIAFSAPSGRMFVVNGGSNNVSVISQSTGKVVKTLAVGHGSVNIKYDAINQEVYSANYESGNVSIINASTEKIDNTIPTNNFPFWSTVDPATGSVYVVNSGSSNTQSNLTVIARTQLASPIGSIPLAVYPYGLVYDSGSASLFTGDPGGSTTYQVGPGSNLVTSVTAVGLHPQHLAYDTINHDLFVVNQGSENLTVLDASLAPVASVPLGISPTGIAFDPSNGFLYVSDNYGGNVTVINGTNDHVQTVITIKPYDLLTAVLYDPHSNHLYVTDASGSNVSVINGATDKVLKSIHVGLEPDSLAYDSSNNTVFVANTGSGNLSVINDSSDSIAHTVPVYSAGLLAYDAGRNIVFDANSYSPVVYPVNASNYTVWGPSIPLGGSQAVSGIAYDPTTEETVVASEDDGILSFLGVRGAAYPVTFQESGLPNGTTWSVTFGGLPNSSKTTDIGFSVGNGSASFSVGAVTGFTVNRSSGSVDVLGAPVVVDLGFSASASIGQADFSETGLPQGTGWNVTYNGVQQGSTTPEIDFAVPAGRHGFTVPDSGSYVPSPASGNLGVTAGGTSDQLIQFAGGSPPGALRVTLTADPSSFGLGATTVLKSTVSGGTAPYTFVYTKLPAGCASANSSTLSCTPTTSGTVNVTVTVTDPAGDTGHNMTEVAVSGSSPPNNGHQGTSSQSSGLPPWAWWILLLIAILALVAGLIAYRRRRKDRPAPSNGNPPAPPAIGLGAPPPPPP